MAESHGKPWPAGQAPHKPLSSVVVKESGVDISIGDSLIGPITLDPVINQFLARVRAAIDKKSNPVRLMDPTQDRNWTVVAVGVITASRSILRLFPLKLQGAPLWVQVEKATGEVLDNLARIHKSEGERKASKPVRNSTWFDGSAALIYILIHAAVKMNDKLKKCLNKNSLSSSKRLPVAADVVTQVSTLIDFYWRIRQSGVASEAPFYLPDPSALPDLEWSAVGRSVDPVPAYRSGWWNNGKLQSFYVMLIMISSAGIDAAKKSGNKYTQLGSFLANASLSYTHQLKRQCNVLVKQSKTLDLEGARGVWNLETLPVIDTFMEFSNTPVHHSHLFLIPFSELPPTQPCPHATVPVPVLPPAYLAETPSITVRLVSAHYLEHLSKSLVPAPVTIDKKIPILLGMAKRTPLKKQGDARPNGLIIHFHGGGFIACDSFAHEAYLRVWSKMTGYPILSVDYRLAPEYQFPVQLHECYMTYVWARSNLERLGVQPGAKVVLCGDSAGATMVQTVTARAINEGFQVPDGVLIHYPVTHMNQRLSPSRLISLIDPLLSHAFIKVYQNAYEENEKTKMENPWCNPASIPQSILAKFPPAHMFVGAYDCLLDDAVLFTEMLQRAGADCTLSIYDGLGHGFLSMVHDVPQALGPVKDAAEVITRMLAQ